MYPTWRWYGPADPITIDEVAALGVDGVVTALHHIENGAVWSREEIRKRKQELGSMPWSVVESVPVHEGIKQNTDAAPELLKNYRQCLENLSAEGINTVCYNFMPVLDWTRTRLAVPVPGGTTVALNGLDLVAFDVFILAREHAAEDYPAEIVELAADHYEEMSREDREEVSATMLKGLPGSEESFTLVTFRDAIAPYLHINRATFKDNLRRFLEEVVPTAAREGIKLTIHPDDPPWPVVGLPRIVSTVDDLRELLGMVDDPANGLCLCTGSLGSRSDNDLPAMAREFVDRINFIHLRNVKRDLHESFTESGHLQGDVDMAAVMRELLQRGENIPYRPDHGFTIFDDRKRRTNPGYSLYGRMRGLAELEGLRSGLSASLSA
ncbi:mannonate dehydratase [Lewinella aquimaris]|uniref:Mannonate dehydratase n=1 Tax=Neolewinella aquimaris TaxID=1835722 RepID=A0A840E5W0_9BACT|nr:mannonate dehydratase [Neolewinella aquimaris]MBB4078567.1 mannonate dehydratase [Neolewinella aquimaris]